MVLSALDPYPFLLQTLIGIYIYIYISTQMAEARCSTNDTVNVHVAKACI